MIRLVEGEPDWGGGAEPSPFRARIYTQWKAYAGYRPPLEMPGFYRTDGGALFSQCDGVLTIEGAGFDPEELRGFLRVSGCQRVICGEEAAQRLALPGGEVRYVNMIYRGGAVLPDPEVDLSPRLDDVFRLLQAVFENMAEAKFDYWYPDVSLKIRRNLARVGGISRGGVLLATAGVYYRDQETAVLGSVATRPEERGQGLASRVLRTLLAGLLREGLTPVIVCQNAHAQAVYERLGFEAAGGYYEIAVDHAAL